MRGLQEKLQVPQKAGLLSDVCEEEKVYSEVGQITGLIYPVKAIAKKVANPIHAE